MKINDKLYLYGLWKCRNKVTEIAINGIIIPIARMIWGVFLKNYIIVPLVNNYVQFDWDQRSKIILTLGIGWSELIIICFLSSFFSTNNFKYFYQSVFMVSLFCKSFRRWPPPASLRHDYQVFRVVTNKHRQNTRECLIYCTLKYFGTFWASLCLWYIYI